MKGCKTYLVECQAIKLAKINDIPRYGKLRYQRRQITIQNVAFYNAINGISEIEQKPAKQQPK